MSELTITTNSGFSLVQNVAKSFAASDMVPATYKGKPANVVIALDLANRLGMAPLMVMQNLHIINGRPAWSSQFIIASINQSGKFTPLRFEFSGSGDDRTCVAWAHSKDDGARVDGPSVGVKMAKAEGWWGKNGSKWPSMTDLMLTYRAAAFFGRTYCPEMLMGIYEENEIKDFVNAPVETPVTIVEETVNTADIKPISGIPAQPMQQAQPVKKEKVTPTESNVLSIKQRIFKHLAHPNSIELNAKLREDTQNNFLISNDEYENLFNEACNEFYAVPQNTATAEAV